MDRRSAAIEGPVWPLVALNVYVFMSLWLSFFPNQCIFTQSPNNESSATRYSVPWIMRGKIRIALAPTKSAWGISNYHLCTIDDRGVTWSPSSRLWQVGSTSNLTSSSNQQHRLAPEVITWSWRSHRQHCESEGTPYQSKPSTTGMLSLLQLSSWLPSTNSKPDWTDTGVMTPTSSQTKTYDSPCVRSLMRSEPYRPHGLQNSEPVR